MSGSNDVQYFQLLVNDGMYNSTAYANITIIPVADNDPVINPDGDPTITENMGPVPIIYNIIDDDQLAEHQLIYWINISLDNAIDKVSMHVFIICL